MITSSQFFKKTFFPSQGYSKNQSNSIQINSHRQSNKLSTSLNYSIKKNGLNGQVRKGRVKNLSELQASEVSPWHQDLTQVALKQVNNERQRIKSLIQKYKYSKTIEHQQFDKDTQHHNFISHKGQKSKKPNYILLQNHSLLSDRNPNMKSRRNQKSSRNPNHMQSVDLNKTYEMYLNSELTPSSQLIKSIIRKGNKSQCYNGTGLCNHHGQCDKFCSKQGKNATSARNTSSKLISTPKVSSKQKLKTLVEQDLKCSNCKINGRDLKTYHQNDLERYQQKTPENLPKDEQTYFPNQPYHKDKRKLVQKGKFLKQQPNRKLIRNNHTRLSCLGGTSNPKPQMKINFQISGNKAHKLEYALTERTYNKDCINSLIF